MSRRRTAGLTGGLLGLVAAGAAVGLTAERYAIGRTRLRPDPDAAELFFALPADRVRRVVADDGVPLHVEEVGPPAGEADLPTVVFCHGYTQQLAVWHYQRQALSSGPARLVFWDHRSHGRSGRSPAAHATIEQLGRDLSAVLSATVPRGPVVLVGHSMGGMTIMALAAARPELFGPRIRGVALLGTSAGKLAELTFGLPAAAGPVTRRALPFLTRGMSRRPAAFERTRRLGTDLGFLIARRLAFGDTDVSPSLVEFVERMTAECPVEVIGEFYDSFAGHDKLSALDVLQDIEVLVLVGSKDLVTPESHSRAIAGALPRAQLVVVEGAGHLVQLERPGLVTEHLRALVQRAARRPARTG